MLLGDEVELGDSPGHTTLAMTQRAHLGRPELAAAVETLPNVAIPRHVGAASARSLVALSSLKGRSAVVHRDC
jgi:hypothetical protein